MGKNKNNRDYYVYGYLRLDTNTYFYIGQGRKGRCKDITHRSNEFKEIINKYDWCIEIIKDNLTKEESLKLEREMVEDLVFNEGYSIDILNYCDKNTDSHLVNKCFGGFGNAGVRFTDEHNRKISESNKGRTSPNKGKPMSEEQKMKISKTNSGHIMSEEQKKKLSIAHTGKKLSIEHRQKLSESRKGLRHKENTKLKMSFSNKKRTPVYCFELDKEFIGISHIESFIKNEFGVPFNRNALAKKLSVDNVAEYCKIELNGKVITLHWKYI